MITPEQLCNAARFGQTIRPETLEWLADFMVAVRSGNVTFSRSKQQHTLVEGLKPPSEMTEPTINLDELIRLLTQAIEYPSPSSADPDSAPICIICPDDAKAMFASLEKLKRIEAVKVPAYPRIYHTFIEKPFSGEGENIPAVLKEDYDTLLDLLRLEIARADYNGEQWAKSAEGIVALHSKLAAVMKLGQEPSEEMIATGHNALGTVGEAFKAILASLEKLKRIEAVKVPEEPYGWKYLRECLSDDRRIACSHFEREAIQHIDTLLELLRMWMAAANGKHERAEAIRKLKV
jgi:hypothetical protein